MGTTREHWLGGQLRRAAPAGGAATRASPQLALLKLFQGLRRPNVQLYSVLWHASQTTTTRQPNR